MSASHRRFGSTFCFLVHSDSRSEVEFTPLFVKENGLQKAHGFPTSEREVFVGVVVPRARTEPSTEDSPLRQRQRSTPTRSTPIFSTKLSLPFTCRLQVSNEIHERNPQSCEIPTAFRAFSRQHYPEEGRQAAVLPPQRQHSSEQPHGRLQQRGGEVHDLQLEPAGWIGHLVAKDEYLVAWSSSASTACNFIRFREESRYQ